MAFDLTQYEPVAERLDRWLKASEQFAPRVFTNMESIPGADVCVIKAELWLGDTRVATGYAEETRGAGNVNRTSHVENCETSAIGRALANAGYAGSDMTKRPSREEMSKVARHPVSNPTPSAYKGENIKALFPDAQEVTGGDLTVKGTQHGELPNWLYAEAQTFGVTQVWDNRDKVGGTRRPWFKDCNGEKAFWPPKGTPDPVILPPIEEQWDTEEEPF
jgi:hypothetical protein